MSIYRNRVMAAARQAKECPAEYFDQLFERQIDNMVAGLTGGEITDYATFQYYHPQEVRELIRRFNDAGFRTEKLENLSIRVYVPEEPVPVPELRPRQSASYASGSNSDSWMDDVTFTPRVPSAYSSGPLQKERITPATKPATRSPPKPSVSSPPIKPEATANFLDTLLKSFQTPNGLEQEFSAIISSRLPSTSRRPSSPSQRPIPSHSTSSRPTPPSSRPTSSQQPIPSRSTPPASQRPTPAAAQRSAPCLRRPPIPTPRMYAQRINDGPIMVRLDFDLQNIQSEDPEEI